ncbi:MAG: type II secretion system F family protein [Polymorphobacter sp.]|uniref:type II secretion system F family protein n=1 Tax=Polymorphobacter sp. TaxID=1909290 RepID=UPI003A8A441A
MNQADLVSYAVMAIVFIAVVLTVLAVAPLLQRRVNITQRLSGPVSTARAPKEGQAASLRTDQTASVWARIVAEVEKRGLSLADTKGDALAEKLMLAGYDQPFAPRVFVLTRTVLTLALPIFALIVIALLDNWPSPGKLYILLVVLAAVGLYLPNFIVNSNAAERKKEILNGFPDTLDLMLVCVEAGLGLDAAFSRVGTEISRSHPLIARLFAIVSLELRAGRTRETALRSLARRTAVPEIGAFVTLVIQSDRLGASISQALKVYAEEMREARKMRAEEKAMRIPVLLAVPLVGFLLPTMVAVLMLPASIQVKNAMADADVDDKGDEAREP